MKKKCIIVDNDLRTLETINKYVNEKTNYQIVNHFSNLGNSIEYISTAPSLDLIFYGLKNNNELVIKTIRDYTSAKIVLLSNTEFQLPKWLATSNETVLCKSMLLDELNNKMQYLWSPKPPQFENADYFFVKSKGSSNRMVKIRYNEIIAIESMKNYISIYTLNQTITTYCTMKKIIERLQHVKTIVQVHRSFLVALNHIEELEKNTLRMRDDIRITVSPTFKPVVSSFINGLC